jgi:hypothetical protein
VYIPGKLIYFDPFHFKDGSPPKPKYFLVLKIIDKNVILASLPSSVNHLPRDQKLIHGCLEIPDACINCYIFEAGRPVTKSGWSFSFHTMLYGNWLDDFEVSVLENNYPIEGVDYEIIGELTEMEFENIIRCFANSSIVKRKYRRALVGQL